MASKHSFAGNYMPVSIGQVTPECEALQGKLSALSSQHSALKLRARNTEKLPKNPIQNPKLETRRNGGSGGVREIHGYAWIG
jgi:hypothetical protein